MMETSKCPFIILVLMVGVIIAGCNGGPSCSDAGGSCDVDSDCCAGLRCGGLYCCYDVGYRASTESECCSGQINDGVCCYGVGVEVSDEVECCSGQINDGVCCAPEGADCEGNCCGGLSCSSTGRCVRPQCPPGCYWVPQTSTTRGSGGYCECGDSHGGITVVPPVETCVECDLRSVCPDMPFDQYYVMKVSWGSTEEKCEIVGPFWASSPGRADACAESLVSACRSNPCSVEDVTYERDPSCE